MVERTWLISALRQTRTAGERAACPSRDVHGVGSAHDCSFPQRRREARNETMTAKNRMNAAMYGLVITLIMTVAVRDMSDSAMPAEDVPVACLNHAVEITFDDRRVPNIDARTLNDAMIALGYVHANDRFFQMDGMRRLAAGELAAAFGPPMLTLDKRYRPYRLRRVAAEVVEQLDDEMRLALDRYAKGVNHAINTWDQPPFEYASLNVPVKRWQPEDSVLVMLVMFDMLHIEGDLEKRIGVMRDALPDEVVEFLTPRTSRFDALLIGGEPGSNDWEPMPIPGPDVIDLRAQSLLPDEVLAELVQTSPHALGSNNWAVAGTRTKDGRAILANDPHLAHNVPPIWYRAEMHWLNHELSGLTLPGLPGVVIGSNGHVVWGFTNSMYDFQDQIIIEVDPDDPTRYRTPDGYEQFGEIVEEIAVRGRGVERMTLRTTRWGVVTDEDHRGRPLVLKWTALEPEMVGLNVLDIALARTLEEGVEAFRNWRGPSQNVLLACREGRIAWVVSGVIPKRIGFDGTHPVSWADGDARWDGAIDEDDRPVIIDPPGGILFTANNRTISRDRAENLGGIWTVGSRARRIFELLEDAGNLTEQDLFKMQLDTRLALLDFYRDLALEAIEINEAHENLSGSERERLDISRALVEQWNGTADGDQAAMRLLNTFRRLLHQRVIGPLVAPARQLDGSFAYRWFMEEEPLRRILEERPEHLLPRGEQDWSSMIGHAWLNAIDRAERQGGGAGLAMRWDEANRLTAKHPLGDLVPGFGRALHMPNDPQPGHSHALRVATPTFGASARMVISPGRESDGILHTPGGQSGDPRSPHFKDGHIDWLHGRATPFRTRDAVERNTLIPASDEAKD